MCRLRRYENTIALLASPSPVKGSKWPIKGGNGGQMWFWQTVAAYPDVNVSFCPISNILAPNKRIWPFVSNSGQPLSVWGTKRGQVYVWAVLQQNDQNITQINISSVIIIYLSRTNQIYEFITWFEWTGAPSPGPNVPCSRSQTWKRHFFFGSDLVPWIVWKYVGINLSMQMVLTSWLLTINFTPHPHPHLLERENSTLQLKAAMCSAVLIW